MGPATPILTALSSAASVASAVQGFSSSRKQEKIAGQQRDEYRAQVDEQKKKIEAEQMKSAAEAQQMEQEFIARRRRSRTGGRRSLFGGLETGVDQEKSTMLG